jgi:hypothetical protein
MNIKLTLTWESDTSFNCARRFKTVLAPESPLGTRLGTLRRFSNVCIDKLSRLKEALTSEMLVQFAGLLRPERIRQAVNEADALAAHTPFPALFLPALAEEKVLLASRWQTKQRLMNSQPGSRAA